MGIIKIIDVTYKVCFIASFAAGVALLTAYGVVATKALHKAGKTWTGAVEEFTDDISDHMRYGY